MDLRLPEDKCGIPAHGCVLRALSKEADQPDSPELPGVPPLYRENPSKEWLPPSPLSKAKLTPYPSRLFRSTPLARRTCANAVLPASKQRGSKLPGTAEASIRSVQVHTLRLPSWAGGSSLLQRKEVHLASLRKGIGQQGRAQLGSCITEVLHFP